MTASKFGHTSIVEVLLNDGADVNHEDLVSQIWGGHWPVLDEEVDESVHCGSIWCSLSPGDMMDK